MAPSKNTPPPPPATPSQHHYYTVLPPQPHDENYNVLPYYYSANPWRNWRPIIPISLILIAALVYSFWPSDPMLKVHNLDIYSMDYKSLDVAVGYRGKKLGHVKSNHGHVRALASSYIDAELELKCVKVLSDVVFLLEDLARGTVPFDTVTEVIGQLGLFFFEFPLKVKLSCEVLINTTSQTIARQNCNPK